MPERDPDKMVLFIRSLGYLVCVILWSLCVADSLWVPENYNGISLITAVRDDLSEYAASIHQRCLPTSAFAFFSPRPPFICQAGSGNSGASSQAFQKVRYGIRATLNSTLFTLLAVKAVERPGSIVPWIWQTRILCFPSSQVCSVLGFGELRPFPPNTPV